MKFRNTVLTVLAILFTTFSAHALEITQLGHYDTPGRVQNLAISGDYVYLADYSYGLRVIDVSDPENPVQVGASRSAYFAKGIAVDGDIVYLSDYGRGVRIYDVSDPSHPRLVATQVAGRYMQELDGADGYVYTADHNHGNRVIDATDPTHPSQVGYIRVAGYAAATAINGDYLYLGAQVDPGCGLYVVDVSTRSNPRSIGYIGGNTRIYDIAVVDGYAYLADQHNDLQIIDVSDPRHPSLVGELALPSYAHGVAVEGDFAYVASKGSGLYAVDVSDPENPVEIGSFNTDGSAYKVAVSNGIVYVADYYNGLVILDARGVSASPEIAIEPQALEFGDVVCQNSAQLTFDVSNVGNADLTVSNITVTGDFETDFNDDFVVEPDGSTTITVTYNADTYGAATGIVTITSDDAENPEVTVSLSATCIFPVITVSEENLNFGEIFVSENSNMTFLIGNDGTSDLTVSGISVDGDCFVTDFENSFVVTPGNSVTITATFTPETYTDYAGTVTITSNDPENSEVMVGLAGLGLAPDITLSDGELDFGDVEFRRSAEITFDIGNDGNYDLTVSDIYVDGDDFEVDFDESSVVEPEGTSTITVTYTANTLGDITGEITIVSDDPYDPEVTVALSGTSIWVSPLDLLPRLCEYVADLRSARILNRGQANSLCVKTRNAARRLEREQVHTALNILNAYINQVNCFIEEEILPEENGQWLIFEANFIINLLEEFGIDGSGFALTNALPTEVTLSSAYPNPFNSTTTIKFGLPEAGYVNITVYDLNGRQVRTLVSNHLQAGYHNYVLEGNGFKSGTYLVRMITSGNAQTLKLTFIK